LSILELVVKQLKASFTRTLRLVLNLEDECQANQVRKLL